MTHPTRGSWRPTLAARLFSGAPPGTLRTDGTHITLSTRAGRDVQIPVTQHGDVEIHRSGLWSTVRLPGGHSIRGLSHHAAHTFQTTIQHASADHDADLALARIRAWWDESEVWHNSAWAERTWITEEMIRHREAARGQEASSSLSAPATARLQQLLEPKVWDAFFRVDALRTRAAFQNDALSDIQLRDHREFFDTIEKTPLTDEQARAVICHDNRVLLVASAGSGKTSTIVAKAGWLVRQQDVRADEMLLLAFNSDAAAEMGERIETRLAAAGVDPAGIRSQTFHSFGLRVIGEATGVKPRVGAGLEYDNGLEVLDKVVTELKAASRTFAHSWWIMQNILGLPDTITEPDAGLDSPHSGFRTLDGDIVKSNGERAIANWLSQCGVDVLYEHPYSVDVADAAHSQYRPDFYYPEIDVWHEHWALTDGQAEPAGFEGYLASRTWKKELHRQHGTRLLETTAQQFFDGTVLDVLDTQLRAHGIVPDFDPDRPGRAEPMVTHRDMLILFRTFLTHAKCNRLSDSQLRERAARGSKMSWRESTFLKLFDEVRRAWDARLASRGEVDFDDMLNAATDAIRAGTWESPYRVIIVDEFQDSSQARVQLIQALVAGPHRHLFAVGDDWQSIYRFAGSDTSAMTRFSESFGTSQTLRLERTFRNGQELSTSAGKFVMQNPAQIRKTVSSTLSYRSPILLAQAESDAAVARIVAERLATLRRNATPGRRTSVKILGRYVHNRELLPSLSIDGLDVHFQTIHASKGLEADHVIILGLNRGAFPSVKEDDPLMRLAMPDADSYPFAEERRLFYVALTRARESVLLVSRKGRESPFVRELIEARSVVTSSIRGEAPPPMPCPACAKGLLILKRGRFGPFYGCNQYPRCTATQKKST